MDKELIDRAWSCLPKEFKEGVRETYKEYAEKIVDKTEPGYRIAGYIATQTELKLLFGLHNLTSDTEGEEMLTVPRKKVQEMFAANERSKSAFAGTEIASESEQINHVLFSFFGANCLPDELTEDNFANKEPLHGDNLSPEPKPAPTFADDCKSRPDRTLPSYTSQPVTNCHRSDRLHIAAMAMQALLSNADRMKMYEDIASDPLSDNLTRIVARNALRYADALVAEAHKPTQC